MATRNELLTLADRVEAATGPGRELDAEIARAIGWGCVMRDPEAGHRWICWRKRYRDGEWIRLPHYTFSIDAALTLVPEGWFIYGMGERVTPIIYKGDRHEHIDFWAETQHRQGGLLQKAFAATPALALVAASLRAIAEESTP